MSLVIMYIENMLRYMIIAIPFYIAGRILFIKRRQKPVKMLHEIILVIFSMYVVGLVSQTIIPKWDAGIISNTGEFYFNVNLSNENSKVNLIPFRTLYQYFFQINPDVDNWSSVSLLNISANMLLFSPIGFFVPLIWKNWFSFKQVLFLGLTVTFLVEIVQLFIGRSADIDDVILNTVGVTLGYGLFLLLKKINT